MSPPPPIEHASKMTRVETKKGELINRRLTRIDARSSGLLGRIEIGGVLEKCDIYLVRLLGGIRYVRCCVCSFP